MSDERDMARLTDDPRCKGCSLPDDIERLNAIVANLLTAIAVGGDDEAVQIIIAAQKEGKSDGSQISGVSAGG